LYEDFLAVALCGAGAFEQEEKGLEMSVRGSFSVGPAVRRPATRSISAFPRKPLERTAPPAFPMMHLCTRRWWDAPDLRMVATKRFNIKRNHWQMRYKAAFQLNEGD